MAEQQSNQNISPNVREQVSEQFSQSVLDDALSGLSRLGGFSFLEATIEGIQNLNPERKARKKMFLVEEQKQSERDELAEKIDLWLDLLTNNESISEMVDKSQNEANATASLLSKNQLVAVEAVRDLEKSYRAVQLFYKNTELDKLSNITIVNASPEQLSDLDNSRFIDFIADEINQNYDRLDLRENYSILVIPGFLGSNKVIEKWAKIAHNNKVMLFTDFADLDKPDDVVDMFFSSNLAGGDTFKSNTVMSCNWLIGRGAYKEIGEEDDLHVSPSSALAGKVYKTLMSQVTAGKKFGGLNEVDAVVFPLKKSEISQLEAMGLVPMVNEYGKVMAFSAKTLFNGDNLGLQTYSVVRVFDYITKVLFDFLNRRSFENWNVRTEQDLRSQIVKFLDGIQGPGRLIESFKILRIERDPVQKDRIYLDIHISPYFPSKSFVIKLDGTKGDDGTNWESEYQQDK
ncbi:DUF5458 family protein [Capnocytophaga cynodegmi]|uniref:Type VI secretion system contractile sheath protein TssC n=1 Tax=Capnocytophaga cynodegmi TaxID=28189 RepID=A0A250E6Z9_9FLAO|nr:DUF5458 family protein [Capnocytophaga cynodegmi]ATA67525.1 type VI secretion system contractile sheath protein TssC [Capnocytophaga cynodegmi]GIM54287.1 hypothetical protein CAPN005_09340 [Capnocytophaga cynodegmi]